MSDRSAEPNHFDNAQHGKVQVLSDADLDAVAGALSAGEIMILRFLNQYEPSLVPAVFKRTNPAHIC